MENPAQIIRSWNLQGSFANGSVSEDKLVPKEFTRIRTPFVNTWREEKLLNTFDWDARFVWSLPESLRVVSSLFLRIELPEIPNGMYKDIPGLYALDEVRFLSAGTEGYKVDPGLYLRDYVESLTDEESERFCRIFLGYRGDGGSNTARTLLIPVLLPNSAYMSRNGKQSYGHGVFPAYLGSNRLDIEFKVAAAANMTKAGADAPAAIAGSCHVMIHQVDMASRQIQAYSDHRGSYSIITRRFTEVTSGWTAATANTRVQITQKQPIGCITELYAIAVPTGVNVASREIQQQIQATHFSITSDSVIQKSLNTKEKCEMELWQHGFIGNKLVNSPSRLCFAAHCADAENLYSGGFNMAHSSQITVDIEFAENANFKIYAIQLQRVVIDGDGNLISSLD